MAAPLAATPPAQSKPQSQSASPPPEPGAIAPVQKLVDLGGIDAELDALDDSKSKSTPAKTEKPPVKAEPQKAKPKSVSKPNDDLDIEPESDPEPELNPEVGKGKPSDDPETDGKPVKAADLRTAYNSLKKKLREEYEPKVSKLESRIKELESRKPEDNSPLVEELKSAKAKLEEYESEIRFTDYKKSQEFQDKYDKPYKEAWHKAMNDLSELTIELEDGSTRQATATDLISIANMPLGEARAKARALFGDAADDIMAHRRIIRDLSEAQEKALTDAKKNSGEHEKKLAAQREIQHQETLKIWQEANKSLAEKYPKWFRESEGDQEGNELLRKGFSLADLHFIGPEGLRPEQIEMLPSAFRDSIKANGGKLKLEDRVRLDALLRNKIASHSRIARQLKNANARIAELEKNLSEYEKSEPAASKGGENKGGAKLTAMEESMNELEDINRRNS